jgi:hypothetical protein
VTPHASASFAWHRLQAAPPTHCQCTTNTQRRARLDELAEARRQLDEELANLHRELGEDPEPCNRQPALLPAPQLVPVQEQRREGNGEWQERRPTVEQPRARALMPSTRGRMRDND